MVGLGFGIGDLFIGFYGFSMGFLWGYLSLADDRFFVVAGHIMVSNSIIVKVVQDSQTVLISLSVIWLGSVSTTGVGPLVGGGGSARRPSDCRTTTMVDVATSPEIFLSFSGNQV
jgi:hypothetical protein